MAEAGQHLEHGAGDAVRALDRLVGVGCGAERDGPRLVARRNPYRGCEHGCVYCFARPNHGYVGLSPGLDFETRLFSKPDAAALLERELSAPGYQSTGRTRCPARRCG
jgi:hypothetical protein